MRREPVRVLGILTHTLVAVRVDRHGWHRVTWSCDYELRPTTGWRKCSKLLKVDEHCPEGSGDGPPKGWHEAGFYETKSFHKF